MGKSTLFLSYDGMTDPLGQSQVLPYLQGLQKEGYTITLISFEKPERFEKGRSIIDAICTDAGITWIPLTYTKKPPILSTLYDVYRLKKWVKKLHQKQAFSLIHCRGYITALVGLSMKKQCNVPFLFDMRGFFADERVDGGIWPQTKWVYRQVYHYFKKKEREFITQANHIISLTEAGKNTMLQFDYSSAADENRITVIPCCADLNHFSPAHVKVNSLEHWRKKWNLSSNQLIVSYVGSVGTWYMLSEMLDFFKELLKHDARAVFLWITKDEATLILDAARLKHIPESQIMIQPAERAELPSLMALSTFSLFFIKPVFSKKASSPTKQGELMGMGIPVVCNAGVGDTDYIVEKYKSGVVVSAFTTEGYQQAIEQILSNPFDGQHIRAGAFDYFSLQLGVDRYIRVYNLLTLS